MDAAGRRIGVARAGVIVEPERADGLERGRMGRASLLGWGAFILGGIVLAAAFCGGVAAGLRGAAPSAFAGPERVWPEIARGANALAVDSRGVLYVADRRSGNAIAMYEDGEEVLLPLAAGEIDALAVDAGRRLYAASAKRGEVYRIDPDGRARRALYGLPAPVALAVDRDGGLYIALGGRERVVRIPGRALERGIEEGGLAYAP